MASEGSFSPGDVVQLKSGGPRMTVAGPSEVHGADHVSCDWFEDGVRQSADFRVEQLQRPEPIRPISDYM